MAILTILGTRIRAKICSIPLIESVVALSYALKSSITEGESMSNVQGGKRIRIALIQPAYARYRQPLFEMFQDDNDVDFFFLERSDIQPSSEYTGKLLSMHELGKKKSASDHLFSPRKKFLMLLLALIKNRYTIIITSCYSPQTMISLLASRITRSKYVLWIEEWFFPKPKSFRTMIRFSLLDLIAKYVLENAGAVVVEGTPQRRHVRNFGVPNEKVFQANHSSLDYSKFKSMSLRQKLNIGNAFVILYLGRIIERKGLDVLIKAFSKIEHEREDAYLVICGDGNFRGSCESIVKEMQIKHVIFAGLIQEEEKASFYKTADVFVLPSRIVAKEEIAEGWGLVINEAMSMGKPVITTDAVGAAEDLVRNGINGYVVKNGEIEELYLALRKMVEDPRLRKTMGENSRIIFEEFNDFGKMFKGFKKAIEYSVNRT
jgi:glycosyltransferase involved in cell wall biosynthesis